MITEDLQQMIDLLKSLPPEEQDRIAAAMRTLLQQPPIASESVRPEVMAAFEQAMANSTDVLDYLQDK